MTDAQRFVIEYKDMLKPFRYEAKEDRVIIVFPKHTTVEDLTDDGAIGKYFAEKGFDVLFETGDFEYTTKPVCYNQRGMNYIKGHKAYLRNRLMMIIQ